MLKNGCAWNCAFEMLRDSEWLEDVDVGPEYLPETVACLMNRNNGAIKAAAH